MITKKKSNEIHNEELVSVIWNQEELIKISWLNSGYLNLFILEKSVSS